jgi:predicted DNA-binding protein (UPF0251 family)
MNSVTSYTDTPLDVLRDAFEALMADPCPLTLPGADLGHGLPDAQMDLADVRQLLLARKTRPEAKRAIWSAIVARSQAGDSAWTVVAAGLAYPALAGRVLRICEQNPGESEDVQAEVLTEFLVALKNVDAQDPAITDMAGYLTFKALTATKAYRRAQTRSHLQAPQDAVDAVIPLFPAGHPDIVLARAVRLGVITERESELIGRLHLEDANYAHVAKDMRISVSTLYRFRKAAVERLAAALSDGILQPL